MKIKTLGIDIGHNVRCDVGAVGIRREDDLNTEVGRALISKCVAAGISTVNCAPKVALNLMDSLNKRCIAANNTGVDFFISIHHNACPGGHGTEVLCLTGGVAEGVGNIILGEISSLGLKNRGVKDRRDIYVINNTNMKAIVIECAFCDSAIDMNGYSGEKMAEAIFRGICKAFDFSGKGSSGNTNVNGSTTSGVYHTVVAGDTLWGISIDWLVEVNGIRDKNLVRMGEKLRVS